MSLPMDLVYEIKKGSRKAINLADFQGSNCKEDLIFIRSYRQYEYFKKIDGRYIYARNLLPREIEDFRFYNDKSLRSCTVVEKYK
jgi:hypothetical protein